MPKSTPQYAQIARLYTTPSDQVKIKCLPKAATAAEQQQQLTEMRAYLERFCAEQIAEETEVSGQVYLTARIPNNTRARNAVWQKGSRLGVYVHIWSPHAFESDKRYQTECQKYQQRQLQQEEEQKGKILRWT